MNQLATWIATIGPVGRIKFAPGTFGSLCALPLVFLSKDQSPLLFVFLIVFVALGIWSSGHAAKTLKVHDPSSVVIDEVCGMMASLLFVPINWYSVVIGFVCFRFFDVLKPPPIRFLEKAPGGIGIVLDDLGAGLYANLVLQIIFHYA